MPEQFKKPKRVIALEFTTQEDIEVMLDLGYQVIGCTFFQPYGVSVLLHFPFDESAMTEPEFMATVYRLIRRSESRRR